MKSSLSPRRSFEETHLHQQRFTTFSPPFPTAQLNCFPPNPNLPFPANSLF